MKQEQLKETWIRQGEDREELEELIADVTKATTVITVTADDLRFLGKQVDPESGEEALCEVTSVFENGYYYPFDQLTDKFIRKWDPDVQAETLANGMVFLNGNQWLSCFNGVRSDLAFMGISGDCTEVEDDTYFLMGMIRQMIKKKGTVKLVLREAEDNSKMRRVITVRSKAYMHIPQTEAYELVRDAFPDGQLESWLVSNQTTEALYTFKEQAVCRMVGNKEVSIYPYVHFRTSDAGESGLSVELGFDIGGKRAYSPNGEAYRKHKGTWDSKTREAYVEDVDALRDKFTEFAEKLDELNQIELFYGEPAEVIANLIDDNKKFKKLVNTDVRKAIIEEAKNEFTQPVHTAAEVILYLLDIPDRLTNLTASTIHQIRKACGEFPYIKMRGFKGLNAKH